MRKSGGANTKVAGTSTKFGGVDHQRCVREWRRRDPIKTAHCLADRYGAPLRTAENWLNGTIPSGHWLGVIFEAEDAEFLERVMPNPPGYVVRAAEQARLDRRRAQRSALAREIAALDAELDALGLP